MNRQEFLTQHPLPKLHVITNNELPFTHIADGDYLCVCETDCKTAPCGLTYSAYVETRTGRLVSGLESTNLWQWDIENTDQDRLALKTEMSNACLLFADAIRIDQWCCTHHDQLTRLAQEGPLS
ncbi:hypothetical protein [Bifidobacterium cuniculi]|uniref:Uncharacterized protein n=1 Tax=Bifidobacterium cuniculi TaxID=1688 RepID=A0A087B3Z2_9BIFI|nr:hypothetical protein [Bifidobacterium cuniculi]KFI65742.1 hypothetical protein BCUN_0237 [Bifidobacterium cuniculi]